MTGAISGQCHCGAVRVTVSRSPDYVNECNCSLCRSLGARWVYYASSEVEISGETSGYVRADLSPASLVFHHCPTCGTTTHWSPLKHGPHTRMGMNARLFDEDFTDGIEFRYPDGKNW